jgi:hypothetical protein
LHKHGGIHFASALALLVAAVGFANFGKQLFGDEKPTPGSEWINNSLPMFDGETLAGWEGNAYWFRVDSEGDSPAIVAGRLDEKIPHNEFLCTPQKYDDFELRCDVKLVGEGKNAGIQFRSKRITGNTEVSGYQADAGSAWDRPIWGALYDESRRKKMLAEGDAEMLTEIVRPDDWNQLRIVCQGNHVQIFLNGQQTVDYTETDDSIPAYGLIGLQIHSGPPSEAWYRNIRVRQFRSTP